MKYKYLILVICISLLLQGCAAVTAEGAKMENKTYSISDFTKVRISMTYAEVVEVMGEPTGSQGFGIVWQTYGLSDGSYVKLLFGSGDQLASMCIVDTDDRIFELKQD
jgi:hypothetical protein